MSKAEELDQKKLELEKLKGAVTAHLAASGF